VLTFLVLRTLYVATLQRSLVLLLLFYVATLLMGGVGGAC